MIRYGMTISKRFLGVSTICAIMSRALRRCREVFEPKAPAEPIVEKGEVMSERQPLTDADGEVRELTAEDMRKFCPVAEVLSEDLLAGLVVLKKQRGKAGPGQEG